MQNVAPEPSAPDSEPALDRYLIGGRDASRVAECARCLVQIASPGMHKFWIASPSEVHHQGYRVPALRGVYETHSRWSGMVRLGGSAIGARI